MINCLKDNLELVSSAVPCGIQQNASLLINLDALEEREDIYSDDNGVWVQNACKTNYFTTTQTTDDHVLGSVTRVSREEQGDITVQKHSYVNKPC